jgi:beta-phosphoglucomutase-like phosphatase (HAD superfamily)
VAKGLLLDFDAIARHADGDPLPLVREIQNLGYDVHRREFQAACDCVMYLEFPRRGHDSAEKFLEAVFEHLEEKPKKTELMSLAPVFAELHRYALHEDVAPWVPALAKGRKVAVVSCLPSFAVYPTLLPIKEHVAAVVTPKESKATPPNPKVYLAALAALKLKAKDAVLVTAHCADLPFAKAIGLRGIFIPRRGEGACVDAIATLRTFNEVDAALKVVLKADAPLAASPPAPSPLMSRPP